MHVSAGANRLVNDVTEFPGPRPVSTPSNGKDHAPVVDPAVMAFREQIAKNMQMCDQIASQMRESALTLNPRPVNITALTLQSILLTLRTQAFILNEMLLLRGVAGCITFGRKRDVNADG